MAAATKAAPLKLVAGADSFGASLKDALVSYAKEKGIPVEDLGTDKYYSVGDEVGKRVKAAAGSDGDSFETRGIVVCGTGMGVTITANKHAGVYAALCDNAEAAANSRSINNSNVITMGANHTSVEKGKEILDAWLGTDFRAPCPASEKKPWSQEMDRFFAESMGELAKIRDIPKKNNESDAGAGTDASPASGQDGKCPICVLANAKSYEDVQEMPGGSWQILRKNPTSAFVRFVAGSVEPAHHHTYGHDITVVSGKKRVYNLSAKTFHDLGPGDYLFTPAGDIHRVSYFTDTEFFIKWDGPADILPDEDLASAKEALSKEELQESSVK